MHKRKGSTINTTGCKYKEWQNRKQKQLRKNIARKMSVNFAKFYFVFLFHLN